MTITEDDIKYFKSKDRIHIFFPRKDESHRALCWILLTKAGREGTPSLVNEVCGGCTWGTCAVDNTAVWDEDLWISYFNQMVLQGFRHIRYQYIMSNVNRACVCRPIWKFRGR
ncbi:MAG: hypothetical protein ACW98K_01910 [Candidatus Kariarchaeaceae archaeon]